MMMMMLIDDGWHTTAERGERRIKETKENHRWRRWCRRRLKTTTAPPIMEAVGAHGGLFGSDLRRFELEWLWVRFSSDSSYVSAQVRFDFGSVNL
ncbi:hypothetical protein HanPI659440_Chr13g0522681 [Helianthus annuus]|nr:hypothetical protein HanPI659440_Chr13g0522681 [Helianthus annuus]